jgi:hypothetical protein
MPTDPALTFRIQSVVYREFALQQIVVTDPERAEAMSDPSKSLAGGVRPAGSGIGRTHDFREQCQRRIVQLVRVKYRVETHSFTVVPRTAARTS